PDRCRNGVVICVLNGIPAAVWGRNLAAWMVGGIAACLLWRGGTWVFISALGGAVLLMGCSFLGPEQMGVHRWVNAGPVSLNVAVMMLPAALVALAWLGRGRVWPWGLALVLLVMLAMQPDRSQALAFGVGVIWLALRDDQKLSMRLVTGSVAALTIAGALLRPDPLAPVPEVEEILLLGYAIAPALAVAAAVALLVFALAPAVLTLKGAPIVRRAGEVLSLYFLISAAMPFVGAYPVPLVGIGMSPILGAWLATGVLACLVVSERDGRQAS
ncbi:MAG TPA: hypothetical protein PLN33_15005, partial [Hyphomonadaceae bacterium]|nr:hypothetical protein [Hyphomonadaceae bacterium]